MRYVVTMPDPSEGGWKPKFQVNMRDLPKVIDTLESVPGFYVINYGHSPVCLDPKYVGSTGNLLSRLRSLPSQNRKPGSSPFLFAFGQIPAEHWHIAVYETDNYEQALQAEEFLMNTYPDLLNCRGKKDIPRARKAAADLVEFHQNIGNTWHEPFGAKPPGFNHKLKDERKRDLKRRLEEDSAAD